MRIEREIHISASPARVIAYCNVCPCPNALTFLAEGAGTRVRVVANVSPNDLAEYVETLLVELICEVRDHFDHEQLDPAHSLGNENNDNIGELKS